jgi:uncharacterized protein
MQPTRGLGLAAAVLIISVIAPRALRAEDSVAFKASYTKLECMIPMRDGVRLYTAVYAPKDTTLDAPILLNRTPYACSPYGVDNFPPVMPMEYQRHIRDGYILVFQDVRGRYMSEGEFQDVRPYKPEKKSDTDIDETSDTYDTVDWLIKNLRHHNGRVGIKGLSYGGFYAWMGTIDAHPAVKAASPQAPVARWMGGDDFFHNGAFLLPHAFNFYGWFGWPRPKPKEELDRQFDHGTPDEYKFFLDMGPLSNANARYFHDSVAFWKTLTENDLWNDFWSERDILPHLKGIRPATLVVGGWFDTENLYGALNSYAANERQTPGASNMIVMGPWFHGQWWWPGGDSLGRIQWGSPTSRFYTDSIEIPFFNYYLKMGGSIALPEAFMFNTGANVWRRFDEWPPRRADEANLYLGDNGVMSFVKPGKVRLDHDEYVNDPSRPVPYTAATTHWYNPAFMLEDQRFASRRPDVLVYQTDRLENDVTIAGPIDANLYVSTSGTDADWVVKVIDVFPDTLGGGGPRGGWGQSEDLVQLGGYQMLVRGDVLRGKFRNSMSKPEPFQPNTVTPIRYRLNDVLHSFKKGHRIMVQIQSSWFPMIDRNPGKFVDIFQTKEEDFQKTTQRVYRSGTYPSCLTFKILK